MTETRAILQSGEVVAGYRIADVLGIGGMAVVYRAHQISLERLVALKILNVALTSDETFRARFRREGTLAASLEHPNIVPVYDSGEDAGRLYIAMRLIEGGTLADRMHTDSLTPAEALKLLAPIAEALDVAHQAGLVHRDVKPANILVGKDGHPYLADFGVARGGESDGLTSTGSFIGSINYASPEQIRGEPLTAASDIYSFTAVAYQCLTGQVPYPRETDAGVMHAHLSEPPPTVPDDHLSSAVALQEIIARGMAKRADERFVSAGTVVERLGAALEELPAEGHDAPAAFGGFVRAPASVSGRRAAPEPSPDAAPGRAAAEADSAAGGTVAEAPRVAPIAAPTPPPAKPKPRPGTRSRSTGKLIGAAVAVGVALPVLALLLSGGGDDRAAAAATAGDLELRYQQPWTQVRDDPALVPGLRLRDPVTLSTTGTANEITTLRAGRIAAPAGALGDVPPALKDTLDGPPTATQVQAGNIPMVQYDATTKAGRRLRMYVLATEDGQYAITCSSRPGSTSSATLCRDVAATAGIRGASAITPAPDAALAAKLAAAMSVVTAARRQASLSGSLKRRARAAGRVAASDRRAAALLAKLSPRAPDRPAIRDLRAGLGAEARALDRLAAAARKRDRSAYQQAREALARAQSRIRRSLAVLKQKGYSVKGGSA